MVATVDAFIKIVFVLIFVIFAPESLGIVSLARFSRVPSAM
jgi:hypothetical protein